MILKETFRWWRFSEKIEPKKLIKFLGFLLSEWQVVMALT
jgi:hypothetical protein